MEPFSPKEWESDSDSYENLYSSTLHYSSLFSPSSSYHTSCFPSDSHFPDINYSPSANSYSNSDSDSDSDSKSNLWDNSYYDSSNYIENTNTATLSKPIDFDCVMLDFESVSSIDLNRSTDVELDTSKSHICTDEVMLSSNISDSPTSTDNTAAISANSNDDGGDDNVVHRLFTFGQSNITKCIISGCNENAIYLVDNNHNNYYQRCLEHDGFTLVFNELYRCMHNRTICRTKECFNDKENLVEQVPCVDDLIQLYNIQNGRCAYCHYPVTVSRGCYDLNAISIDRKNSNGPYILSNLAFCCAACNRSKSENDFDDYVTAMYILCKTVPLHILQSRKIFYSDLCPKKQDVKITSVFESCSDILILGDDTDENLMNACMKENLKTDNHVIFSIFENQFQLQNMKTHHFVDCSKTNLRRLLLKHSSKISSSERWSCDEMFALLSRQSFRCFISGIPFCFCGKKGCPFRIAHIILDIGGHSQKVTQNVRFVCSFISRMKGNLSMDVFVDSLVSRIISFNEVGPLFHPLKRSDCVENTANAKCSDCYNINNYLGEKLCAFRRKGKYECLKKQTFITDYSNLIIQLLFSELSDSLLLSIENECSYVDELSRTKT
jgi:hypothetical protein